MTRPSLPPGYRLTPDPDAPQLLRLNKSVVCGYGPAWAPKEVEKDAWRDFQKIHASIQDVEEKLREWRNR